MNGTYDHLKYCAARFVWPRRKKLTPASARERKKQHPDWSRVVTWEKWWEQKFNDHYSAYVQARMKEAA